MSNFDQFEKRVRNLAGVSGDTPETASGAMLVEHGARSRLRLACYKALERRGWNPGSQVSFTAAVQMVEDVAADITALVNEDLARARNGKKNNNNRMA